MFWKLAKALFQPLIQFFTDIEFPGLNVTIFHVFIGVMLIDVIISVVFIILGVSNGSGDLPATITYDYLDEKTNMTSRGYSKPRPRKPNYGNIKAGIKARRLSNHFSRR